MFVSEKLLRELVQKIRSTLINEIVITAYCREKSLERRLSAEDELSDFLAYNCVWRFSQHKGEKGRRIVAERPASKRKIVLGVFEVNAKVYFVNAYIINARKQKRIGIELGDDKYVV